MKRMGSPLLAINSSSDERTIVDLLRRRAYLAPQRQAFKFLAYSDTKPDELLTYASLDKKVCCLAAYLQDRFPPGTRVLMLYGPGLEFVMTLLACFYAQLVAVPAVPPRPSRPSPLLSSIVLDATPGAVLTTTELLTAVNKVLAPLPVGVLPTVLTTDDLSIEETADSNIGPISPDTLAILQYTSGSTSDPKGVMITHANIAANAANTEKLFALTHETVGVSWLPAYHDMGLIGSILQPLYTGFPAYLMSPAAFIWKPVRWLQAISTYRATCSGGPNFAFAVCTNKISRAELELLDLESWITAYTGAEPVQAATLAAFAHKFATCGFKSTSFSPCYGLAEATLLVSAQQIGQGVTHVSLQADAYQEGSVSTDKPGIEGGITLVSCGEPAPEMVVKVVDPLTNKPCKPDAIGEILIAGANVMAGYWNKSEEENQSFFAREGNSALALFRTGDLGFFHQNNLYISGRLKDMIIINGRNLFANDIEFTVESSLSALGTGAAAAFAITKDDAEQVVVVLEVERSATDELLKQATANISKALAERLEVVLHKLAFVRVGAIPRTSSGKIRRHLCRTLYQTDALELVG